MSGGSGAANTARSSLLAEIINSYRYSKLPTGRYVVFVILPLSALFGFSFVIAYSLPHPLLVRAPIPALAGLFLFAGILYPKLKVDARQTEIDDRFHLLMTHMTVLATTNIERMEVFRELASEAEYGAAADEIARLVQLVDSWNQSLDDACRRRAKQVPSDAMSDFLERLGYTLSAGQSLDDFLLSEQHYIIEQYETIYESALANLEVMKDLYLSMILSMTFALVFAIVLPILIGTDPTLLIAAVILLFVFVQCGFLLAVRSMSPTDPAWFYPPERDWIERRLLITGILGWMGVAMLGSVTILGEFGIGPGIDSGLFLIDDPPRPLTVAFAVTPLLIIGLLGRRYENRVVARDQEFPSFIRALGASESAKQSPTSVVLSTLREKNFGALSIDIERLYRRLNARVDTRAAWEAFTIDTRSNIIQKFSEMYVTGRQMGGDPKQLGELISTNMNTVNQLREQRRQSTITLIGLLYGITAAATFAFFVGLEIVQILTEMSADLRTDEFELGQLVYPEVYNVQLIEWLLLGVILVNAAISAVMIRTVDGGRYASGYAHFVGLTWVGCLTAIATSWIARNLLAV